MELLSNLNACKQITDVELNIYCYMVSWNNLTVDQKNK